PEVDAHRAKPEDALDEAPVVALRGEARSDACVPHGNVRPEHASPQLPPRCSKENVQDAPINQAQRLGAEQGHQGLRLRQDAVVPLERITFEKGTLTTLRAWGQIKLLDRRGERHNVVEVIQVV